MLEILSLCDREGVQPPSVKITMLNLLVKKETETFRGVYFFRIREKNFKPNLVFVLVLI